MLGGLPRASHSAMVDGMDGAVLLSWLTSEKAVKELHGCWAIAADDHVARFGVPMSGLAQVHLLLARIGEEARALNPEQVVLARSALRWLARPDIARWLHQELGERTGLWPSHVRVLLSYVADAFADALSEWRKGPPSTGKRA